MKKLFSVIFVLMLCSMCFCGEITSTLLGNLDTDDTVKYHVGVMALTAYQELTQDIEVYDFKRVEVGNPGAYLAANECVKNVVDNFSVKNGDLYKSLYKLSDYLTVLVFLYKTHQSATSWNYYCYSIITPREPDDKGTDK